MHIGKKIIGFLISFILMISSLNAYASSIDKKFTVSGHISDANNGEMLIGATIFIKETKSGAGTNLYGFYSISLPLGNYTIEYSYVGYQTITKKIQLEKSNLTIDVELQSAVTELEEVVVTGEKKNHNITSTEMSVARLPMKKIASIPAFMGEVDVIKAIQLLPGVQSTSEGSSGFSVRGGSPDQNLILLDEASVYNASHFMGFFSVFNNDAVKDVKLYKGDIPAEYGGRASSVLDVRMKEGNNKKYQAKGGIGLISSRLTVEGPIVKDKMSFILAGRRTYADLFLPLAKDQELRKSKLYFYDLNSKLNYRINSNNRIFFSGYFGSDLFKSEYAKMGFGNQTGTIRWNHLFSSKFFSNYTFIYSKYDYLLGVDGLDAETLTWESALNDKSVKMDYTYYFSPENTLKFGASTIYHTFIPGIIKGVGFLNDFTLDNNYALEHGIYISDLHKFFDKLSLRTGLRMSIFQNVGTAAIYTYDNEYNVTDTTNYSKNDIFHTFKGFEPRIGLNYEVNENMALKCSYARTKQYIHLATNSVSGTPLDVWFPSNPNIMPETVEQYAVGVFRNFKNHSIETSIEAYYKNMFDVIDFKDFAELLLNPYLAGEIRRGTAKSYGLEFLINIPDGKLNGWISYTYSHTYRTIQDINMGKPYLAPYDKPHDFTLVLSYNINKNLSISGNWIYATGRPVTFPLGKYKIGEKTIPYYSGRNEYRLPDYHRLDLSINWSFKKAPLDLVFSVYNAYARKNVWTINFVEDENNSDITYAEMTYLFSIIPALTLNFDF